MPDSFNTTERLGQLISGALGGKPKPGEFAPYFTPDRAANSSVANVVGMLRRNAGKPK